MEEVDGGVHGGVAVCMRKTHMENVGEVVVKFFFICKYE